MTHHEDHYPAIHARHATHDHDHNHDRDEAALAELLDLDALVLGSYLGEATQWAASLIRRVPRTILDVGSGTGAGILALAKRFPDSSLVALDRSADMLAATVTAAAGQGLTDRMGTIEADLERPWPASATADLMWASSSLHELRDPERTMGEMYAALNPGGLLVVMEMDSLPSFLPTEPGDDAAGLDKAAERGFESRLHAAMSQQGWNVHPDWRPGLERAGFKVIEQRSFHTKGISAHEPIGRFAANFFGRIRLALADAAISGETLSVSVSTQDLATLDVLLSGVGPRSLLHRRDLQVRGRRTAWAAFKP